VQKVTSVEGIAEYSLHNGLHFLVFPDPSKPTITVNVTYLVGSRQEGSGEGGMAHLLEHMVFKGSTNHLNIMQELTEHGCRPNGSTTFDRTNYFETFQASDENLKWALDMESDRMVNSFIKKEDFDKEFSVVRNEFEAGENNPFAVLYKHTMAAAYIAHSYGRPVIGNKSDVERVTMDKLQAFYRKYYQPDDAVLTLAGKVDEPKIVALVNEYFGKIPRAVAYAYADLHGGACAGRRAAHGGSQSRRDTGALRGLSHPGWRPRGPARARRAGQRHG
jgi:zinc protease